MKKLFFTVFLFVANYGYSQKIWNFKFSNISYINSARLDTHKYDGNIVSINFSDNKITLQRDTLSVFLIKSYNDDNVDKNGEGIITFQCLELPSSNCEIILSLQSCEICKNTIEVCYCDLSPRTSYIFDVKRF